MTATRRDFLIGCSAAIAAYGARSLVHAGVVPSYVTADGPNDILVVLFLRGGMDGLHLLGPADDADYIAARPENLRVADKGEQAGLQLEGGPANFDFRLHRNAEALKDLYDSKHLAFIHACGLANGTRSHFEAMDLVERGVADVSLQKLTSGWITRHLACLGENDPNAALLPAFAAEDSLPTSLLGFLRAGASRDAARFGLWGGDQQRNALEKLYGESLPLHEPARRALTVIKTINDRLPRKRGGDVERYEPQNGAKYPGNAISQSFQTVARLIRMDLGLRVATVDFGGWDTHQDQTYFFPVRVKELADALAAFYTDMTDYHSRLTVVVHSEFGRRLKANKSSGTDHGHGSVMMVMGGNVEGGKIHGTWPGLATEQLDSGADLAVTTDYRQVLAEIISKRQGNEKLTEVFPGLQEFKPIGIVRS